MKTEPITRRRDFLKTFAGLGAAAIINPTFLSPVSKMGYDGVDDGNGTIFLFQGDSITDGNRSRNNDWNHVMGHGYQYIVASKLWYEFPAKGFQFFNRGISGNKVTDLAARWQKEALDLKPQILSILIGINDASTYISGNENFSVEKYETAYRSLLQQTKAALPKVQLVLCEPFILAVGKVKDNWDDYLTDIKKRQEVVRRLSLEYDAIFVPFQQTFDNALARAPAGYWIWDGIHPMPAGHELMAREWTKQVSKKCRFIK